MRTLAFLALLSSLAMAQEPEARVHVRKALAVLRDSGREAALREIAQALGSEGEIALSAEDFLAILPVAGEAPAREMVKRWGPGPALAEAIAMAPAASRPALFSLVPLVADPLPCVGPLVESGDAAALSALRAIPWEGRALDSDSFAALSGAVRGEGELAEVARHALGAASLTEAQLQVMALQTGPVEMPANPDIAATIGDAAKEPRKIRVFYGTDRARFAPGARDYAVRFLPALLVLALAPLVVRLLLWLLHPRFARVARALRWAALAAGLVLLFLAAYGGLRTKKRLDRLGIDYGPERGAFGGEESYCEFGTCLVGIPPRHGMGEIERPGLLRGQPWEDPERHVMILRIEPLEKGAFLGKLGEAGRERAFVFVHGFNVTFEDAALRTAQIAHDLEFDGAPVFFSWPSRGEVIGYTVDESTVAWATHHLKLFLRDVRRALPRATIHLVAHSMGNRALTEALRSLREQIPAELPGFQEVVLAAPDIDAATFREDIVPALRPTAERITLYCAPFDSALEASRRVHGYPRAGDSSAGVFVAAGIETVDVAIRDTDILGHSYYGSVGRVLEDIVSLLLHRRPPADRGLTPVGGYWRLSDPASR